MSASKRVNSEFLNGSARHLKTTSRYGLVQSYALDEPSIRLAASSTRPDLVPDVEHHPNAL